MYSRKSTKIRLWMGILTITLFLATTVSGGLAQGPSITPESVEQLVYPGESYVVADKTVTTSEILPKPDIYFLADNTGSMAGAISNVQTNATNILNAVKAVTNDPRFGAGWYRDFPFDNPPFLNQAPIPASDDGGAAALAAINAWYAWGGADEPEAQLYALDQIAAGASWRSDSSRIVVWFGDSPGHDPVCSAISGLSYDVTEASVTAKLVTENIKVIAIDLRNLNGAPIGFDYVFKCGFPGGSAGQATRIAAATGGVYLTSSGDVAQAILDGLKALPVEVSMESDCTAPISTTFAPASQTVTSGTEAVFEETISVAAGAAGGTYTCKDWALLGGLPMTDAAGNIIYETKTIHVPGISLAPATASNELLPDATHTVVATVSAGDAGPLAGVPVEFEITAGPHAGLTGSGTTDAEGKASYTYGPGSTVSPADLGTDTIQASFTNADGTVVYGSVTATKKWVDTTPPVATCDPGFNPAGKVIPAAPGKGGQGQNQDGFYLLNAIDIVWPAADIQMWVTDTGSGKVFGPFAVGTDIKYTEDSTVTPFQEPMSGVVAWHIVGKGDAKLTATDGSGNTSTADVMCLVPPPPK